MASSHMLCAIRRLLPFRFFVPMEKPTNRNAAP